MSLKCVVLLCLCMTRALCRSDVRIPCGERLVGLSFLKNVIVNSTWSVEKRMEKMECLATYITAIQRQNDDCEKEIETLTIQCMK